MTHQPDLLSQVSRETLLRLLEARTETDSLDFKETLDISTTRGKVEFAKDVLAFANTEGGGHIIFGVTDDFEPIGLSNQPDFDTTTLYNVVRRYTEADIDLVAATHEVLKDGWEQPRLFAIVYVARYAGFAAVASSDGAFQDETTGKIRLAFKAAEILIPIRSDDVV